MCLCSKNIQRQYSNIVIVSSGWQTYFILSLCAVFKLYEHLLILWFGKLFYIIPIDLGIPFASFSCWIPCHLVSSLLGPPVVDYILQQYPEYLGASFDLENEALFWGNISELVFQFPSLSSLIPSLFRIPIFFRCCSNLDWPPIILSLLFSCFLHLSFWFSFTGRFPQFYLPAVCRLKKFSCYWTSLYVNTILF